MLSLLPLVLLCAPSTLLLLTATTSAADDLTFDLYSTPNCTGNTNDSTRGSSAFQANLDTILSYLPTAAAASSGFADNITGAAPDQVYGLAQCRGDIGAEDCRACLNQSAHAMASKCAGSRKDAEFIYEGCLLRYSNASFFGELVDSDDTSYLYPEYMNCEVDVDKATEPQFSTKLAVLMGNLAEKAYASPRLFAADSDNLTVYHKIYGMVQCTRDLAAKDCKSCLDIAITKIPEYADCRGQQRGQIFSSSCSIRFDVTRFYNAEAAMPTGAGSSRRTVRKTILLVSVPLALTLLLLLLLLLAVYICKNRTTNKRYEDGEEIRSSETLQYHLGTLRAATNNFSEENILGKGGFGLVYKGTMQNGQEIAVKRLSKISQQGLVEMKNEIALIAKLQHKNLVRLLGFCIDEEEKLIVYEFLSNKSLNKILFDPATQQQLSWDQRYKIIEGISRGLLYLHEDSRLTIIHRDLKPGNILLDADMNPKISDFGLAKLFEIESSVENTRHIAGTYGYIAPEYANRGIFSTKSDVFSYGVLVLEIVTGRRASEDLLNLVWRHWSLGSVLQLLDGYPPAEEPGRQEMLRCIHIGLLCVQEDPQLRPRMASVLLMLRNRIVTMSPPTKPAFVVPVETPMEPAQEPSINKVSVSDLEAR